MDFKDEILQLADRVAKQRSSITTEEATKNAFIMPMIAALGYNPFDPFEVVPEFTCDAPTKKDDKIDYAIMQGGKPILLVECKHCGQQLEQHDKQLFKYYTASKARFALLTNGIQYRFFTDLVRANVMDAKPFLEIDITCLKDNQIDELKRFHKSYYNESAILSTAAELQTLLAIKEIVQREFASPTEEFVRFFVREINDGKYSAKLIEQYMPFVKKSINSYINDVITDRLNNAIDNKDKPTEPDGKPGELPEGVVAMSEDGQIITTQEEIDAYNIVRSILRKEIDVSRITYKDNKSYFIVNIDNSTWKWICRFFLNRYKYISFPTEQGGEEKIEIKSLDEIFNYADRLQASLRKLLKSE